MRAQGDAYAAIVRRIWLPGLDAGYDPQGLVVDGDGIYVSAYRSDSLGVRGGPCRVMRIDLETGDSTGYLDVPSPCGHAGGLAVGGDGMLYVADTHTAVRYPACPRVRSGCAISAVSARPRAYWRARRVDARWDLARHLRKSSRPALPLHGGEPWPGCPTVEGSSPTRCRCRSRRRCAIAISYGWLASIGTSVGTANVSATALRFFFKVTLKRHDLAEEVVSTREPL
jgi:hypothetical protein